MIATKLDVVNQAEIQKNGLAALKDALGVTNSLKEMNRVMPHKMQDLLKKYIWEIKKIYMTYDFNLDNNLDIKPIFKNENHFRKWILNYPFYANIQKEGVVLYGTA